MFLYFIFKISVIVLQSGQGFSMASAPQTLPNSVPAPKAKLLQSQSQSYDQIPNSGSEMNPVGINLQSAIIIYFQDLLPAQFTIFLAKH